MTRLYLAATTELVDKYPNINISDLKSKNIKNKTCNYNNHTYRRLGVFAENHSNDLVWMATKISCAAGMILLGLLILPLLFPAYHKRLSTLWNEATSGTEKISIYIREQLTEQTATSDHNTPKQSDVIESSTDQNHFKDEEIKEASIKTDDLTNKDFSLQKHEDHVQSPTPPSNSEISSDSVLQEIPYFHKSVEPHPLENISEITPSLEPDVIEASNEEDSTPDSNNEDDQITTPPSSLEMAANVVSQENPYDTGSSETDIEESICAATGSYTKKERESLLLDLWERMMYLSYNENSHPAVHAKLGYINNRATKHPNNFNPEVIKIILRADLRTVQTGSWLDDYFRKNIKKVLKLLDWAKQNIIPTSP